MHVCAVFKVIFFVSFPFARTCHLSLSFPCLDVTVLCGSEYRLEKRRIHLQTNDFFHAFLSTITSGDMNDDPLWMWPPHH